LYTYIGNQCHTYVTPDSRNEPLRHTYVTRSSERVKYFLLF